MTWFAPLAPHARRRRRLLAGALTTLAAAGSLTGLAGTPAQAAPGAPAHRPAPCETNGHGRAATAPGAAHRHERAFAAYRCARTGDLLDVRIGDVHATQPSLGYDEVYYKLGRYTLGKDALNKKFGDWCEADGREDVVAAQPGARLDEPSSFTCALPRGAETADSIAPMKTVVIGPGGRPYLTDGHHTLTSFIETPDGGPDLHVRLRVLANLSNLGRHHFWQEMKAHKWVYLEDPEGRAVSVRQLPDGLGLDRFQDDRYRSLLYFGRDIGYEQNGLPFQEFYWGDWLRTTEPDGLATWDASTLAGYLSAVRTSTRAMTALPRDEVAADGFTAAQLGALEQWNDGKAEDKGEYAKLAKPYSDAKPGKIAYALEYRKVHGLG